MLYPNVVKLKDGSFQQYGETLNRLNREIYQYSMNSNLIVTDENLHRSLFLQIRRETELNCSNNLPKRYGNYQSGSIPRFGWKIQS